MERIEKKILSTILVIFCFVAGQLTANCEQYTVQQLTTPQTVSYDNCTKTYNISSEKLFYLTLASITANRFEIKEMQSKTGYILFKAANKEFLATVVYFGLNKSMLKITPTNNNYYFAPGIVTNIFKYIDINASSSIDSIMKN